MVQWWCSGHTVYVPVYPFSHTERLKSPAISVWWCHQPQWGCTPRSQNRYVHACMVCILDCLIMRYPHYAPTVDLEMSLAHAVHDHVKRDHIFCLSTSNGNTYYLQVSTCTCCVVFCTCMHNDPNALFTLRRAPASLKWKIGLLSFTVVSSGLGW